MTNTWDVAKNEYAKRDQCICGHIIHTVDVNLKGYDVAQIWVHDTLAGAVAHPRDSVAMPAHEEHSSFCSSYPEHQHTV